MYIIFRCACAQFDKFEYLFAYTIFGFCAHKHLYGSYRLFINETLVLCTNNSVCVYVYV